MTDDDSNLPDANDIIEVHGQIEEQENLTYTGSRVASPWLRLREDVIEEAEKRDGIYPRAAALLRKTITRHVFEDGNKRTAWTATVLYLEEQDTEPAVRGMDAERVLRRIRRYDIEEIAEWLKSGEIDEERLDP
jgi:death-on-curing protein